MQSPAKRFAAPKTALELKRNTVRALLRIYRQNGPRERSAKIRKAFEQMVQASRN